jgi:hypothetical protein
MNAPDVLRYGNFTLLGELEQIPRESVNEPGACGVWSVKDIVAHLASYEIVLVDVLSSCLEPNTDTPNRDRFLEQGPDFNDREVDARRDQDLEVTLTELNDAHASVLELIGRIPPETVRTPGTMPWYGTEYALSDLIVYQYYGHKREHSAQIAVFRDSLQG